MIDEISNATGREQGLSTGPDDLQSVNIHGRKLKRHIRFRASKEQRFLKTVSLTLTVERAVHTAATLQANARLIGVRARDTVEGQIYNIFEDLSSHLEERPTRILYVLLNPAQHVSQDVKR